MKWLLVLLDFLFGWLFPTGPVLGPFGSIVNVGERSAIVQGELEMSRVDVLKMQITLPKAVEGDVVSAELVVTRDPAAPFESLETIAIGKDQGIVEIESQEGSIVTLSMVAVDNAGNVSEPRTASFTVVDDIPPTLEGDFGIVNISERQVEIEDAVAEETEEPVDESTNETPPEEDVVEAELVDEGTAEEADPNS